METQILGSTTDNLKFMAERDRQNTIAYTDGLLSNGLKVGKGYFGGYFTIKERIDSNSGEGEIYVCEDEANKKRILKYYFSKKPDLEQQKIIASYDHEDILKLVDFGEYNGHSFEVMEYAAGGSLADKLPNGKYKYLPVDYDTCNQILKETVNAFHAFHAKGIIHRDIKPENLLYRNADGSDIVVGDFGVASSIAEGETKHLTETVSTGTIGYIAPEVSSGVIGKELDYYALGVTVWVLLTGLEPFVDEKGNAMFPGQIMLDGMDGKTANKLLSRTPNMDSRYKTLIRGLLTVKHDKRWGYDEIQKFLKGETPDVFTDRTDLPPFEFNGKSYCSYSEIADALYENKSAAKTAIFEQHLIERYLRRVDDNGKLFNKISNIVDEHSSRTEQDKGLAIIIYTLCPGRNFYLGEKGNSISISSVKDIIDALNSTPVEIIPHFKNTNDDIYVYLEINGLQKIGDKIKNLVLDCNDEFMLKNRIIVALAGNRIKPFADGVNDNVELVQIEHLYRLPPYLQERVMIMIYQKKGLISAWIENITNYRISEFMNIVSTFSEKELAGWGSFKTLKDYLKGENIINYAVSKVAEGDVQASLCKLKEEGKFALINKVIDASWKKYFDSKNYEMAKNILLWVRLDKTESLVHGFSYYKAMIGRCFQQEEDYNMASIYYDDAIEIGEEYGDCAGWYYWRSGDMAYKFEKYDKALERFEKSLEYEPDHEWLWNRKGNALYFLKRYSESVAAYEKGISFKERETIYNNLANAYEKLNPPLTEKANWARAQANKCSD